MLSVRAEVSSPSLFHSRTGKAGPDQPAWLRRLTRVLPGLFSHILYRWSITQDQGILSQLQAGIRYFDIRLVAVKGTFRVIHCLTGDLISSVLDTLTSWLETHRGEIVVLDFQHFYQFSPGDHQVLIRLLLSRLAGLLCSWQQDLSQLSLARLATSGAQVILIYPAVSPECQPYLWPRGLCLSPWPNTMSVTRLLQELTTQLDHHHHQPHPPPLFVSQALLTPSQWTPVIHPLSSVKAQCADRCHQPVLDWLLSDTLRPNIVITDYVRPDVVNIIINKNYNQK